ncbi:uncharacterized protein LOC9645153 isoform X2 [Selaginella moellendorffii]|uniref:uncharacterized protein LOC9645153 isoform X2 n=1 Tax=Selaginella moellendorffii TaxID=88036 RepID=UPI000D1C5B3B|nr:uncharacterized protein LOC9645153 isoform X2 [Selaginella moellendorffii]XP_024545737.1 uncharacterized protein LOC9645153 isoform X2 [Selaginella moellendorffii]|eukprot:XP_024545736.1 uncharacterized protein LOC9645153 isoform X2 [Selaginella moellendorffii]
MHGVIAFYKDTTRVLVNTLGFQSYGGTRSIRLGGMFSQKSWRSRVFLTFSFREGQVWTSMSKMRLQFRNGFKTHEPQVLEIITFPKFGIGQRAFLIQTQGKHTVGLHLISRRCHSGDNQVTRWIESDCHLSPALLQHKLSMERGFWRRPGLYPGMSGLPARKGEVLLWEGLTLLALHKSSTGLMELKERCFIHWRYLTGGDGQQNSEHNEIVPKVYTTRPCLICRWGWTTK